MKPWKRITVGSAMVLVVVLIGAACSSSSKAGSSGGAGATPPQSNGPVRGFDGTTIKVAALESFGDFQGAEIGAEARFARANQTNELNGIKIQFVQAENDNQDPATALSDVRQLVTSNGIFAIVPDLSAVNPGQYLAQQKVPYVGYAFDGTYCSSTPSQNVWGFGFDGCLVPDAPVTLTDGFGQVFKYVTQKTGNSHPTMVLFSNDNQSGKNSVKFDASEAQGAGFDVVYAKGSVPATTSDYTPYVQQWLTAAGGKSPDIIACYLAAQCVSIWSAVKAAGYKGTFFDTLGAVSVLAGPMAGTVTSNFYDTAGGTALTQMQRDIQSFKPGTQLVSYSNVPAYFAADMFIQALKKVGKNINPQSVQHALDNQSWTIPGLVGPIVYPESTAVSTPACSEILLDVSATTGFQLVEPYSCSSKHYGIDPKFTG
jgi:branched-chain amino acid transport system substrate-binding protein